MTAHEASLRSTSARSETTAALAAEPGLNERTLRGLVHYFHEKAGADALLGPIFAARITKRAPHLEPRVDFWPSVALMSGSYHAVLCLRTRRFRSERRTSHAGWSCSERPRIRSAR